MATASKLMTAGEFLASEFDRGYYELYRGEMIEVPMPNPEHSLICINSGFALESFGRRTGHGYAMSNDTSIQTERGPDTVRGADVSYFSEARWPRERARAERGIPPVPPDLVVEVYSPSNRPGEMRRKILEYLEAGVLMVWVLYPERLQVAVHRLDATEATIYTIADTLEDFPELPGFTCPVACPVAELFR